MITTCTGCHARYRLDAAKVPTRTIRVRCPECTTVFDLDGSLRDDPASASTVDMPGFETSGTMLGNPAPAEVAPMPAPVESLDLELESALPDLRPSPQPEPSPEPGSLSLEPAAAASLDRDVAPAKKRVEPSAGVAVADVPRPSGGRRRVRDKSEMLARALVSDILVYNREARDKALAAGTLLESLGPEIKKSWELYKEKVGAETATGTSHFKDALNEILAEGQKIF